MAEPAYIAVEKIEIKEGSGMVAYVAGDYVSTEAVENLGAQDKVRPVGEDGVQQTAQQQQDEDTVPSSE